MPILTASNHPLFRLQAIKKATRCCWMSTWTASSHKCAPRPGGTVAAIPMMSVPKGYAIIVSAHLTCKHAKGAHVIARQCSSGQGSLPSQTPGWPLLLPVKTLILRRIYSVECIGA
jgi:hypothetical protein